MQKLNGLQQTKYALKNHRENTFVYQKIKIRNIGHLNELKGTLLSKETFWYTLNRCTN